MVTSHAGLEGVGSVARALVVVVVVAGRVVALREEEVGRQRGEEGGGELQYSAASGFFFLFGIVGTAGVGTAAGLLGGSLRPLDAPLRHRQSTDPILPPPFSQKVAAY